MHFTWDFRLILLMFLRSSLHRHLKQMTKLERGKFLCERLAQFMKSCTRGFTLLYNRDKRVHKLAAFYVEKGSGVALKLFNVRNGN